jgi:hypothetical protein
VIPANELPKTYVGSANKKKEESMAEDVTTGSSSYE